MSPKPPIDLPPDISSDKPPSVSRDAAFAWIYDARIRAVTDALDRAARDSVRFVGGCVRDSLLKIQAYQAGIPKTADYGAMPRDIDLATSLTPETVIKALAACDINHTPTGIDHGTLTAHSGAVSLEITTLRSDLKTDGRHAIIRYSKSWVEDAQRRDFTINAFYLTPDGLLYDPLGGYEDLKRKKIRFIGIPSARLAEDYLRILRFFRFSARFGPEPDPEGLKAVAAHRSGLRQISRERVRDEFLKTMHAPFAADIFCEMERAGIFDSLTLEDPHIDEFRFAHSALMNSDSAIDIQLLGDVSDDRRAVLLLAILFPALPARALMDKFALSKRYFKYIDLVRKLSEQVGYPRDGSSLSFLHYKAGRDDAASVLLVAAAAGVTKDRIPTERDRLSKDLEKLTLFPTRRFPVKAADIVTIAARHNREIAGAELGKALRNIETTWAQGGFPDDPKSIKKIIDDFFT